MRSILFILLSATYLFATAQVPDLIFYEGKEYSLNTNPMEAFFEKNKKKRPKGHSTALWRGYRATFEVKNKDLLLKDIHIETFDKKNKKIVWKSFSDKIITTGTVFKLDWYSGILVIPYGDRVHYVHMGYQSTYSKYILLEVRAGKITASRKLTLNEYNEFKQKQFEAYQKTDDYKKQFKECNEEFTKLNKLPVPKEQVDSFLKAYILKYTSKFLDEKEAAPNLIKNYIMSH